MSASHHFSTILLTDVFKRLAAEQGVGTTVITPSRRLAIALNNEFGDYQAAHKVAVWESADIIPFSVFIERLYQDALYYAPEAELPILLTAAQTRALWVSVINDSDEGKSLLAVLQTAGMVHEAWQLSHAWQLFPQLDHFPLNEDGRAFHAWAQSYQHITKRNRQIDEVCLYDLLASMYQQLPIKKPKSLICYGFESLTPQQISFLKALSASNCVVQSAQPISWGCSLNNTLQRTSYRNAQDEIYHAAVWARARTEINPAAKIGIVVPALSNYRSAIIRIFSAVMAPDIKAALPGNIQHVMPFNVSLGIALTSYPLINAVFQILALAGREVEYEQVSLLLRSPFVGGAESEMSNRALLDARLRKITDPVITLEHLLSLIKSVNAESNCPLLVRNLFELANLRRADLINAQRPSAMAKTISMILNMAGFPGERVLDSSEYQTLKKWHEVIAEFATFDSVIDTIHYNESISQLYRLAAETLFQPETPDVPIQILGTLEAAGMEFDHLWVMGLSDEVWPLHPRPNPFLPIELQRQAKLPLGSSTETLNYSRQLTEKWLSCATEIILSHPECSDDRDGHELNPSSLIKHIDAGTLELPVYEHHQERIQRMSKLEYVVDNRITTLEKNVAQNNGISGGVSVIKDYAACPFRAMAKHRLNVESLTVPHVGFNALERGTLIHDVLAYCWKQLVTKEALDNASDGEVETLAINAARQAIHHVLKYRPSGYSLRFKAIEQRRLVRLTLEWLNEEKKRGLFTVVAIEEEHNIHIGGLRLNTRLDRVDKLENGALIIMDYKTQKQSAATLLGERLEEPQLPLYLVTTKPDAAAVVFAQVKVGAMGFVGIVRDADLLPGMKAFSDISRDDSLNSWEELVKVWHQNLTNLAIGFLHGKAQVDPKSSLTCRYCDLQPFCRIYERGSHALAGTQEDDI